MTRVLRIVAWLIVMACIIDPVVAMRRILKPEVAIVSDGRLPDTTLLDHAERALRDDFTVVRAPSSRTAAVVSVGFQMPAPVARDVGLAFAVFPEPRAPFAAITTVAASTHALLRSRLPIDVSVRSLAARGKSLAVTLRRDGLAVDRVTKEIDSDDTTDLIQLQFTPSTTGSAALTIEAAIGEDTRSTVSLTRTVRDDRWNVLFFDRRPSWMSTFVRRSVESDPRFIVTSRVATSPGGPAIIAGKPPASLAAMPALDAFDTLIIGAAQSITDEDAAGMTAWMRGRGGSVLLLLDEQDPAKQSAAFRGLTGVSAWRLIERGEPFGAPATSAALEPVQLPAWAEALDSGSKTLAPSAIWRTPIGRGTLTVSGALDSWRFRESGDDAFGRYWRGLIGEGATRAIRADESNEVEGLEPDQRALVRAWTESRGGRAVGESGLVQLGPALTSALSPASERRATQLMHSPWWMMPLGLVLGAEWWLRRRAGQR